MAQPEGTPGKADTKVGFLKIMEVGPRTWRGGYLVTDRRGTPERFCRTTQDLSVGRFQALLLGKALQRFVFCDAIGKPLLEREPTAVQAVIVDDEELLDLRRLVEMPIALSDGGSLRPHAGHPGDRELVADLEKTLDLVEGTAEVFERISAALREPLDGLEGEVREA
jgi:hypothetical protein